MYISAFKNLKVVGPVDRYWKLIIGIGGKGYATIKDKRGKLLLHYVAQSRASRRMVKYVIREYSRAVMTGDKDNQLPLHDACMHSSLEAAKCLAAEYPIALRIKNKHGKTPFEMCQISDDAESLLLFKQATLRSCIQAHCSNENLHTYGNSHEVSILM